MDDRLPASPAKTLNSDLSFITPGGGVYSKWQDFPLSHFLRVLTATEPVTIQFENQTAPTLTRFAGQSKDLSRGMKRCRVATPTAQTVVLTLGDEQERDFRIPPSLLPPGSLSVNGWTNTTPNSNYYGAVQPASFMDLNNVRPTGKKVTISNSPNSAVPLYVGTDGTDANIDTHGVVVMPGESKDFDAPDGLSGTLYYFHLMNPDPFNLVLFSARWEFA